MLLGGRGYWPQAIWFLGWPFNWPRSYSSWRLNIWGFWEWSVCAGLVYWPFKQPFKWWVLWCCLQWLAGYLGLAWSSCGVVHRGKGLIFVFQEFSASMNKDFILAGWGGLGTGLSFILWGMDTFLIFLNFASLLPFGNLRGNSYIPRL